MNTSEFSDAAKVGQHGRLERNRDNETRCKIGARAPYADISIGLRISEGICDDIDFHSRARKGRLVVRCRLRRRDAILIATWSWPKYPPRPPG